MQLSEENESFFESAAEQLSLSPRGCLRVLKLARTIADLEGADTIGQGHLPKRLGLGSRG